MVRDHSVFKNPLPNARVHWKVWFHNDISYFSNYSDKTAERSHWGERRLVWTPGLRRPSLLRWERHSCTRNRRQLMHKCAGCNPQGSPLSDPSYSEVPYPAGVSNLLTLPLKTTICKTATQVMLESHITQNFMLEVDILFVIGSHPLLSQTTGWRGPTGSTIPHNSTTS